MLRLPGPRIVCTHVWIQHERDFQGALVLAVSSRVHHKAATCLPGSKMGPFLGTCGHPKLQSRLLSVGHCQDSPALLSAKFHSQIPTGPGTNAQVLTSMLSGRASPEREFAENQPAWVPTATDSSLTCCLQTPAQAPRPSTMLHAPCSSLASPHASSEVLFSFPPSARFSSGLRP